MKRENKGIKKLIACLMCAVMIGSAMYCVPEVLATTVGNEPTETKAYAEWNKMEPANGNFEAGYEGQEVYGWSKTAIDYYPRQKTEDEETAADYCKSYTLTTAIDETTGSKVAALEKKGSGHVAATSQRVEVSGEQEYKITFDYKVAETDTLGSNNTDFYGMRFYLEELDESGATIKFDRHECYDTYEDENGAYSITDEWRSKEVTVTTQTNTAYVIIHLWTGGLNNRTVTMYFDNVTIQGSETEYGLNGSFNQTTIVGDGARVDGEIGPAGWTGASCDFKATAFNTANYHKNYKATIETIDGNNVLCYSTNGEKPAKVAYGYSLLQSPYIEIEPGKAYTLQYDFKINLVSGSVDHGTRARITYYNAEKQEISYLVPNETGIAINAEQTQKGWQTMSTSATTPVNTAYVKVGFYAPATYANEVQYSLYFDNVILDVEDETIANNWTAETCMEAGIPREDDDDFTNNYGIRNINEGIGHEDALQLYVARTDGILGGAVFYSNPIPITAGQKYTTSFDLKIDNTLATYYYDLDGIRYYTNETTYTDAEGNPQETKTVNLFGAAYVLRYKDSQGNLLNRDTEATEKPKTDMEWKSYTYEFTAPENAATVEVGLVIGGYTMNTCPKLTYSWDNIVVVESERYNDLLFTMLQGGNAVDATEGEALVDICDLIHMKKYIAGETDTILETADMNNNRGTIGEKTVNNDDVLLLEWKLLGVTTTEQAKSVR